MQDSNISKYVLLLLLLSQSCPHGLQHTRLPSPSLSPRVCSNSCPLSWWCYLTISSSAVTFFFCFPSFPASGSFPLSWLFASGGHNIWASASASVLSMNVQGWLPFGLTGWISLQSKGHLRVFSSTIFHKSQRCSVLFQLSHPYMTTGKTIAFTMQNFVSKVMSLLFNMLSRLVITFLPRSRYILIAWLQLPFTVFWSPRK